MQVHMDGDLVGVLVGRSHIPVSHIGGSPRGGNRWTRRPVAVVGDVDAHRISLWGPLPDRSVKEEHKAGVPKSGLHTTRKETLIQRRKVNVEAQTS